MAARLDVDMPGLQHGSHILVRLDVAVSVKESLPMLTVATLSGRALHTAGYVIPEALADLLPSHADGLQLFLTLAAPSNDGKGRHRGSRPLGDRMGWSSFEADLMKSKEVVGASVRLDGSATEVDVLDAAVLVLEHMALDGGALETEQRTNALRVAVRAKAESARG